MALGLEFNGGRRNITKNITSNVIYSKTESKPLSVVKSIVLRQAYFYIWHLLFETLYFAA